MTPRLRLVAPPPSANLLPFAVTRRDLALSLFYECALPSWGDGTLSEAEEQAALMLGAGELALACAELVVLVDRETKARVGDAELMAVVERARAALEAVTL